MSWRYSLARAVLPRKVAPPLTSAEGLFASVGDARWRVLDSQGSSTPHCRGHHLNRKGKTVVANIKSQKKRVLTNEKAHQRNKAFKSELKTAIKRVHTAIEAGDAAAAKAAALEASTLLDKAASKGIIHKSQAANRKSGVMKAANGVGA